MGVNEQDGVGLDGDFEQSFPCAPGCVSPHPHMDRPQGDGGWFPSVLASKEGYLQN